MMLVEVVVLVVVVVMVVLVVSPGGVAPSQTCFGFLQSSNLH